MRGFLLHLFWVLASIAALLPVQAASRAIVADSSIQFSSALIRRADEDPQAISYSKCYGIAVTGLPTTQVDSVFWTGGDIADADAERFISEELKGKGTWYSKIFKPIGNQPWYRAKQFGLPDSERSKVISRSSKAFAAVSTGTAWLLIPDATSETDPYPGIRYSNWVLYEYNTLTRNPEIDAIWRADPNDFTKRRQLWKRGDAPFGSPADVNNPMPVIDLS